MQEAFHSIGDKRFRTVIEAQKDIYIYIYV